MSVGRVPEEMDPYSMELFDGNTNAVRCIVLTDESISEVNYEVCTDPRMRIHRFHSSIYELNRSLINGSVFHFLRETSRSRVCMHALCASCVGIRRFNIYINRLPKRRSFQIRKLQFFFLFFFLINNQYQIYKSRIIWRYCWLFPSSFTFIQ